MNYIFKAKTKRTNQWVLGTLYVDSILDSKTNKKSKIDMNTLCVGTGVLDKNNKEIFDKDSLLATFNERKCLLLSVGYRKGLFLCL